MKNPITEHIKYIDLFLDGEHPEGETYLEIDDFLIKEWESYIDILINQLKESK